jgi:hypothetical protein
MLDEAFAEAAEAAKLILEGRIAQAQARFNKRHSGGAKADE